MLRLLTTRQAVPRASGLLFPALRNSSIRTLTTDHISSETEQKLLVERRKQRPMSPHLEIYQPQLTWYLSGLHRVTGVFMAFGFVGGLASYAALPYLGVDVNVADLANYWASFNPIVKTAAKTAVAFPFCFHAWNGIRHLVWDTGRELTLKGVYRTGYAVLGLTAVSALGIALL